MKNTIPGFYWGSSYYGTSDNFKWNYIVQVHGNIPFLKLRAWDLQGNAVIKDEDPHTIKVWGPRIEEPIV
jgi:hypothetical protein